MISPEERKNIELLLGPGLQAFAALDLQSLKDLTMTPEMKEQLRNIDDMIELVTLASTVDLSEVTEETWQELESEQEGLRDTILAVFAALPKLEEGLRILKSKMQ